MDSFLCLVFGHKPPVYAEKGWYSPGEEYGRVRIGGKDGLGRIHCRLYADCARCKQEFMVARFHAPTVPEAAHDPRE